MSSLKHRILYADHEWRQQRLLVVVLVIGGLFFSYQTLAAHVRGPLWAVYLPYAYAPAGVLVGVFYYWRRQRHNIEAREDGVHVGKTFSTHVIPYDAIRTARVLPLRQLVTEKRYLPPPVKANLDTPSVVLRFQGEPQQIAVHAKKLGRRHIFEGSAAFPVKDPEAAAREIARHLPEGSGTNLGGARRRGKRRH